jgi:hypothetical protein
VLLMLDMGARARWPTLRFLQILILRQPHLGAAYDEAVARLLDQPDVVLAIIAKRLVALAERGERNVHKLCDEALIAEGFLN